MFNTRIIVRKNMSTIKVVDTKTDEIKHIFDAPTSEVLNNENIDVSIRHFLSTRNVVVDKFSWSILYS